LGFISFAVIEAEDPSELPVGHFRIGDIISQRFEFIAEEVVVDLRDALLVDVIQILEGRIVDDDREEPADGCSSSRRILFDPRILFEEFIFIVSLVRTTPMMRLKSTLPEATSDSSEGSSSISSAAFFAASSRDARRPVE
jgi:hypothetical protein